MRIFLGLILLYFSVNVSAAEWAGLTEDFPPFNYMKDGEVSGICTDIIREVLKREKMPVKFQMLSWSEAYEKALKQPQTFILTISRTPAREKKFKWVGPLLKDTFYLMALQSSKIRPTSDPLELRKYKVSGIAGDHPVEFLEKLGFHVQYIEQDSERYKLFSEGKLDLDIMTDLSQRTYEKKYGLSFRRISKLYTAEYYVAFNNQTPQELIYRLNKNLREFRKTEEYRKIFEVAHK